VVAPELKLEGNSQGFMIRGLPVIGDLPAISQSEHYLFYVSSQYCHCYIDLEIGFEEYKKKFSAKTRSTINRKIRKYQDHCGGTILWKIYQSPAEIREFFQLARAVSKLTYQERLLNAGLPDNEEFIREAESLAAEQRLRAYILFDGDKPVSYLYCPVHDEVLIYAYLGYDPAYMQLSVGTVLQWLALEALFAEQRFRYFDFTEGQSDHKRLFATHQQQCVNVLILQKRLKNYLTVYSHRSLEIFSRWLGYILARFGLKAKIKRLLRFGSQGV
jgi:CelD/BcsL family acetyltransferase involved in cellulose biosynthesis